MSKGDRSTLPAVIPAKEMKGLTMDGTFTDNDISHVVEADRAHIWHHLSQHKPYETTDPRIIVEGKGMKVWDQKGKEHLDAVSGGVWTVNVGYGRESIANAVRDQLIKLNYFAGSAGSIPGALFSEKLIEKMPGVARGLKLPPFAGNQLLRWAARRGLTRPSRRSGPRVLYFLDTCPSSRPAARPVLRGGAGAEWDRCVHRPPAGGRRHATDFGRRSRRGPPTRPNQYAGVGRGRAAGVSHRLHRAGGRHLHSARLSAARRG